MKSDLKTATLKKYAKSFLLERCPDKDNGEAIYMHSNTCGGYCDYACNGNQGILIAEDINEIEQYHVKILKVEGKLLRRIVKLVDGLIGKGISELKKEEDK